MQTHVLCRTDPESRDAVVLTLVRTLMWEHSDFIASERLCGQDVEEVGAVSLNELHDFVTARYRGAVPPGAPSVVKALHLNIRDVVQRLIEEHQLEVCLTLRQVRSLILYHAHVPCVVEMVHN